jgi:hypothetical protein
MPIICVDIVVNTNDRILLVKRDKEPEKETGISVVEPYCLGYDETIFDADPFGHDKGTHTINFVFAAKAPTLKQIALDANHVACSVFTPEEIYGSGVHSYIKKFTSLEGVFRK